MVLAKISSGLETFRHTLNLLKEFPSIIPAAMQFSRTPPLQINDSACKTSGALLSSSRGTSRKQHELQLTSMWPDMCRSSQLLPGDIYRRSMLTSAIFCERNIWTSNLRCTELQVFLYAHRRMRTLAATRKWSQSMLAARSLRTSRMLDACRPSITT